MAQLMITDMIMSFMWIWSGIIIRLIAHVVLGLSGHASEFVRSVLTILNMFLFTHLVKLTDGGAYNPIVVFTSAINGTFTTFLFNIARIPFQVRYSFYDFLLIFCDMN